MPHIEVVQAITGCQETPTHWTPTTLINEQFETVSTNTGHSWNTVTCTTHRNLHKHTNLSRQVAKHIMQILKAIDEYSYTGNYKAIQECKPHTLGTYPNQTSKFSLSPPVRRQAHQLITDSRCATQRKKAQAHCWPCQLAKHTTQNLKAAN